MTVNMSRLQKSISTNTACHVRIHWPHNSSFHNLVQPQFTLTSRYTVITIRKLFMIRQDGICIVSSANGAQDKLTEYTTGFYGKYTQNGILHMLDRNRRIKLKPERFQACKDRFDLIVSCEERVYDQILEDLDSREVSENSHPVHIINIDIQDNHEEATIGAFIIRDLVSTLSECDDMDNEIDEIIQEFEHAVNRPILHNARFM